MKKTSYTKWFHILLCAGLVLTLALSHPAAVYTAEEPNRRDSAVSETNGEEKQQTQEVTSAENAEETSQPVPENTTEPVSEETKESSSEITSEPSAEETKEPASEITSEPSSEKTGTPTPENTPAPEATKAPASENTPVPEMTIVPTPGNTPVPEMTIVPTPGKTPEPVPEKTPEEEPFRVLNAEEEGSEKPANAAIELPDGMIRVGTTTFSAQDEVSSFWEDGKGWKNLPGQYVVLVDYDGTGEEISMNGGVLTLAVAGVNRIGTLKGNCSVNIVGTGIVLIDKIELGAEHSISLMPNTALYEEGSAAVFLKQSDESYLLMNGEIPGILDEDYTLQNADLTVPAGSSLILSAMAIRTETWTPDDGTGSVTEVTLYKGTVPDDGFRPTHSNAYLNIDAYVSRLILGPGSSLTVDPEASVRLEKIINPQIGIGFRSAASALVIQGAMSLGGTAEGGDIHIENGGTFTGSGTMRSSAVFLEVGGNISKELLLDSGSLSLNGNDTWLSVMPPRIKDSIIYLNGDSIILPELSVTGTTSWIGVKTHEITGGDCEIGDITLSTGSSLEIVCIEHDYAVFTEEDRPRYVEDSYLKISGKITGGTVCALGGCVAYTGTETKNVPTVPVGYASRVYVTNINMDSSEYPLIMTDEEAASRATNGKIPVMKLSVADTLISEEILARKWESVNEELAPLDRQNDQVFTCASFLEAYNLTGYSSNQTCYTAVEIIYSNFMRERIFLENPREFSTDNVIMIRVLDCIGAGGQGGTATTHTDISYTGSGVLGGPGSGSVTTGNGKVIYGQETTPTPTPTPEPTDEPTPTPTDEPTPTPTKTPTPEPTETSTPIPTKTSTPTPTRTSTPVPTGTSTPTPTRTSTPVPTRTSTPVPTRTSTPVPTRTSTPTPTRTSTPTPTRTSTPVPTRTSTPTRTPSSSPYNDDDDESTGSRNTSRSTGSSTGQDTKTDNTLKAVVTEEGNGRYTLEVYKNEKKVKSLNGSSVTVKVQDPEGVTENDICYAVFEDNQDKWIPASYDAKKKVLVFKTDQIGTFGIARVSVEDVTYPAAETDAPLYRKMSIWIGEEEITKLLNPVNAEAVLTEGEYSGAGLYAVFVDENEKLHVFPASYDESDEKYQFKTDVTGDFVVVQLEKAPQSSNELYDACSGSDEVRILITIRRLLAFWS